MNKHIALNPCPFCSAGLTLDIDEDGGVAILHSLKTEKNCWFPSIVEVEMPVGTTLEEMTEIINRRPTQESYEHALVGASLVAAARLQDKVFEIQELKAELARLQAERRWIPVSERLPEECEMRVFKDGDAWCFVLPDFQDLQVSPSVWMKKGVLDKIYKELRSVRDV